MRAQPSDPFSRGERFAANPHLYDYLHALDFVPFGSVDMLDGAGQVLNTLVRGRFGVEELGPTAWVLHLTDLVELDPYYRLKRLRGRDTAAVIRSMHRYVLHDEHDVRRRLDPCRLQVAREEGLFVLRRQVVWQVRDEQEWPYMLYRSRYRFAADPLAALHVNRQGNLYYHLEAPEGDTCLYYQVEDAQQCTAGELRRAGIVVEDERS
jgi:hypothetical protein